MAVKKEIGNVDAALEELGCYGKYSLVQFSLQAFAQVALVHHMLSIVFTGQRNPFRCQTLDSDAGPGHGHFEGMYKGNTSLINTSGLTYDNVCLHIARGENIDSLPSNVSACNTYNIEYELPKDRYFVSEFDLVCDREYLAALTQTLLTLGHAIGSIAFPYFADNYGRKPVLLLCSFLWFGSALGLAFSVNYTMFAVFKTLVGIFLQGVSQTSLTVMIEILTSRQRGFMFGCLTCVIGTLSIMLMVPVAYLLRSHSWRVLELAYCIYFIYIILYLFFMDESLRWLAANGFQERVMEVLKKASRWNCRSLDKVVSAFYKEDGSETHQCSSHDEPTETVHAPFILTDTKPKDTAMNQRDEIFTENGNLQEDDTVDEKHNFISLFKKQTLRFYTAFCTLAWFFNNLTYFSLFLMSSTLSGSLYLNYFLNCLVEFPAAIFVYFYIDKLGRKICFAVFSLIAGVSLMGVALTAAISEEQDTVIKVLAIIGKFGITGSFSILFTITPELFPTNVRNTAQGLTNLSACVGGMLAPFAELLMNEVVYAPGLIFGTGSLVLSACTYFLPETAKRELPQTLKDIESWSHEHTHTETRFRCFTCHRGIKAA